MIHEKELNILSSGPKYTVLSQTYSDKMLFSLNSLIILNPRNKMKNIIYSN